MDDISNLFCLSVNDNDDKSIKKNVKLDFCTIRNEFHYDQVSFI